MRSPFLPFLTLVLLPVLTPLGVYAQRVSPATDEAVPEVTRTFALERARVVQAPGRVLERATVVVRDGLITAVGPDVPVPFDADRIAADSLTVYAGFIDGLSHAGVPEPEQDRNRQRPDDPGNPPDEEAGIQPQRDVRTLLDPAEKSLEALRKAGFTAAHVVPYGQMLPGTGAVILTAGDDARTLVFKGDASLFAQFTPARRMYPGTDMAVIAKMRQLYHEAERRQRMEQLYAEDPTDLERPAYDPAHYAFFPVLDGQRTIFFHTEDVRDLYRALDLHRDLGFPMVLTGLNQGFDAVDALRDADVPLLLTLDLPEAPQSSGGAPDSTSAPDSTAAPSTDAPAELPATPATAYNPDFRTSSYADTEAEKKNLEARQETVRTQYYATAATLHDAGLRFGFTSIDAKPADLMKNLRMMVDNGLPEDAALAALTTTPAEILGVSASMGTVERGKMANLVVTTGPLFEKNTRIRYVFVDGRKFELDDEADRTTRRPGAPARQRPGTYDAATR